MHWLTDARLFNYVIMGLQVGAAFRHGADGNWPQAIYWVAGTVLVATVTWGMR